jgi:GntR family transcriptional repressor for pyruvate dehydrogenase complex
MHGATRVTRANEARRADFSQPGAHRSTPPLPQAIEAGDSGQAARQAAGTSHMDNAIRRIETGRPRLLGAAGRATGQPAGVGLAESLMGGGWLRELV